MDFRLTRRALLLAALPGAALAQTINFDNTANTLNWDGKPGVLGLPPGARSMAFTPILGENLAAVAVTDVATNATIEILVLARHDGTAPRIVAVEVLQWQGPEGRLNTRLTSDPNFTSVILDRTAAVRRTATAWRRDQWRDFLVWNRTEFVDKPVRAPMADSLQVGVERSRKRILDWIAARRGALTKKDMIALGIDAQGFELG